MYISSSERGSKLCCICFPSSHCLSVRRGSDREFRHNPGLRKS